MLQISLKATNTNKTGTKVLLWIKIIMRFIYLGMLQNSFVKHVYSTKLNLQYIFSQPSLPQIQINGWANVAHLKSSYT